MHLTKHCYACSSGSMKLLPFIMFIVGTTNIKYTTIGRDIISQMYTLTGMATLKSILSRDTTGVPI